MLLHWNTKVNVRSFDWDTDIFEMISVVLQGDIFFYPYLFIICLDYVLQTSLGLKKEKKARNKKYSAESITDPDYADDLALLANKPAQAKSLLHSL